MTIKNNSLSDRLNDFKHNLIEQPDTEFNTDETEETKTNNIDELKKSFMNLISSSLSIVTLFVKSLVFGYSLKIIFHTDWNFWGFLCIGLMANILAQYIFHLIHPNN